MSMANAGMLFSFGVLVLIAALLIVVIWNVFKIARAKIVTQSEIAQGENYRKLAEEAVAVQKQIAEDLAILKKRVESMEKMLREVE